MTTPPPWIGSGFRLIRGVEEIGWAEIDGAAAAFAARLRGGGVAVVHPDGGADAAAALAGAERAGVELLLRRHDAPIDPPEPTGGGFAVLLETSGTTGAPKLARHDFQRLRGRLRGAGDAGARWLLTYEPASFAGVQVILTALAAGATLIDASGLGAAEAARAAVRSGATRVSATPAFWRAFLMALGDERPPLTSVTLGGEPADQPLLDRLARAFPAARIRHIYASTEAGSLFAVGDGRAGFPAAWLESGVEAAELRVRDGQLQVRSPRAMLGYADGSGMPADGWIATGDLVEVAGDRVLFTGRADGRVSVGGVKVSPEAAERALLSVEGVVDALVAAAPNPITGHILTAEVVAAPGVAEDDLRAAIRAAVEPLPPAARPRVVRLVDRVDLAASGKKRRSPP